MRVGRLAVFVLLCAMLQPATANDAAVVPFGVYSNLGATETDHCYGYHMKLWKHAQSLVGFLYHSEAMCGDTPVGILDNVRFEGDEGRSGNLAFTARIFVGCVLDAGGDCNPVTDTFRFKGKLSASELTGAMTRTADTDGEILESEAVRLERRDDTVLRAYASHAEWRREQDVVFRRAPK